jgi:ABC-type Zn uptake system ZnuABC Zn-binding protein ZnuA
MRRYLVLLSAAMVLAGCGGSSGGGGSSGASIGKALKVVATTTQVQDFTRVIGGDKIKLTGVLKPNVDPHDYEPSPADVDAIAKADVLVKNGVGLETWFDDTIKSAGFHGTTVDASTGVRIRLVAKIKATGVKAVFSESSLPPKTAETIASEAHVKVVEGESALYGDTLGPAGSDGATYLHMMLHNTKTIVSNLTSA